MGVGGRRDKKTCKLSTQHCFPHSAHCFAPRSAQQHSFPLSELGTRNFALLSPLSTQHFPLSTNFPTQHFI
uniref:Uncharacterized protein n=1 Tax=Desertifilum tharense IPPAS B-1220 TaxID=1781255 RepID=A0ACD5H2D6_9CYAN